MTVKYCVYAAGAKVDVPYYSSSRKGKAEAKAASFRARGVAVEVRRMVYHFEPGPSLRQE